jgi:hypothetical protein
MKDATLASSASYGGGSLYDAPWRRLGNTEADIGDDLRVIDAFLDAAGFRGCAH